MLQCVPQAEPRAQLALAANQAARDLQLKKSDLLLYAARVIPGNDTRVTQMMNSIARLGPQIAMRRSDGLHTSGHAYQYVPLSLGPACGCAQLSCSSAPHDPLSGQLQSALDRTSVMCAASRLLQACSDLDP